MNVHIEKGTEKDIKKVAKLYDDLIDYLTERTNYPGWKKGVYPTIDDAAKGINDGELFVVRDGENIAGTIILSHEPETGYDTVKWLTDLDYKDIYVIRTFAVHPQYLGKGIGKMLMKFADDEAKANNIKSIRLDVFRKNIPAIKLYESFGYEYLDTIDEGYSMYGLDLFRIYEKVIK